ncbi:unnamed protein product, partial [Ectocarpus sp. 12 AP-2014]
LRNVVGRRGRSGARLLVAAATAATPAAAAPSRGSGPEKSGQPAQQAAPQPDRVPHPAPGKAPLDAFPPEVHRGADAAGGRGGTPRGQRRFRPRPPPGRHLLGPFSGRR